MKTLAEVCRALLLSPVFVLAAVMYATGVVVLLVAAIPPLLGGSALVNGGAKLFSWAKAVTQEAE